MSARRKKRKQPKTKAATESSEVVAVYMKAKREFNKAYNESGKVSILLARHMFEQKVEAGFPISRAHAVLNSPKEMKRFLKEVEKIHQQTELGKIEQVLKNTSFKSAMLAGLTSGGIVMLLTPFVTPFIQPAANEVLNTPDNKVTETKVQQFAPIQECTNIHNGDVIYLISDCKEGEAPMTTRAVPSLQKAPTGTPKAQP